MHFITQLDPPTLSSFDIFEPRQFSPSQSIGSINKELYEEEWDIWPEDANDHIVEFEESYLNWLRNYESFSPQERTLWCLSLDDHIWDSLYPSEYFYGFTPDSTESEWNRYFSGHAAHNEI